jgi:hypothetical protein
MNTLEQHVRPFTYPLSCYTCGRDIAVLMTADQRRYLARLAQRLRPWGMVVSLCGRPLGRHDTVSKQLTKDCEEFLS